MNTTFENATDKLSFPIQIEKSDFRDKYSTDYNTRLIKDLSQDAIRLDEINPGDGLQFILSKAPQIKDWRDMMKTDASHCLAPFYRPDKDWHTQSGEPVAPETMLWLTDQMLGKELRWRAATEQQLLEDEFDEPNQKALILACGGGYYPIAAAKAKQHNNPNLTMIDINDRSVRRTKALAREQGVSARAFSRDVLHMKGFRTEDFGSFFTRLLIKGQLPLASRKIVGSDYDLTTTVGLSMYLPDEIFPYTVSKKLNMGSMNLNLSASVPKNGLSQTIDSMWNHTKPGGSILFDTMLPPDLSTDSGQAAEIQGKIIQMMGWPAFHMRSINETLSMINQSNQVNPSAVQIIKSPDEMFALFKLSK